MKEGQRGRKDDERGAKTMTHSPLCILFVGANKEDALAQGTSYKFVPSISRKPQTVVD